MMKIVVTISDYGAAMNIGGEVNRTSYIVDVPTKNIPEKLKEYFAKKSLRSYSTFSLSLLNEDV